MAFAPAAVGSVVAGKYRVERVLGQGGMGIVVAARHLRLSERVAIKFPLATLHERSDVIARLVREGRAAMRIHSEHVARVHDVGVLETGEPFLVMEYLTGRDLGATIADGGPLPIDAAVEYILQAIEALAEAHARGIIHRDLKPSNLFLTRRADGSALVKVIDFGISKISKVDGEATLTDTAAVLGSRPYMAPEQMRSGRDIDVRSDIWSLGATLHALLTGRPPFLGGSMVDIYERILAGPPLLRGARPEAPAALEAILLRCMRPDPAQRYADVAELASALAEVASPQAQISAVRAARILSASGSLLAEEQAGDGDGKRDGDGASAPAPGDATEIAPFTAAPETAMQMTASWRDTQLSSDAQHAPSATVPPVMTTSLAPRRLPLWRRVGRFGVPALVVAATLVLLGRRHDAGPLVRAPLATSNGPAASGDAAPSLVASSSSSSSSSSLAPRPAGEAAPPPAAAPAPVAAALPVAHRAPVRRSSHASPATPRRATLPHGERSRSRDPAHDPLADPD